jgi:diaminohydroxyphosphoribosylaminopyrimidine deaminase/5-amino-6-(5-phosphoribosylamino)uracil reductase
MVRSANGDVAVATTTAASPERRKSLEERGITVVAFDGDHGRTDLHQLVDWLASQKYLSLMIEAGSKVNWAALESGLVDRIFFYYAPKILGGMLSLPVAGGTGRRRRVDAIQFHNVTVHSITPDEFAVEAYTTR